VPHIIAIGASAGGLDALRRFFASAQRDDQTAYLVAQHLSPHHKSLMPELLGRHTSVEMHAAEPGQLVEPGHAYLLPPGQDMRLRGGKLVLTPRASDGSLHLPIDMLFTSLAEDRGPAAAAVVLSGLGSDGVAGLRAIKSVGGVVAAQDPNTAQFDGMPGNAIATGLVDIVASPEEIVKALVRALEHRPAVDPVTGGIGQEGGPAYDRILAAVANHTGVDFTPYKRATMLRRIERRMRIYQVDEIADYAARVESDGVEARQLGREFLINVTRFFRDPEVFDHLAKEVFPEIVRRAVSGRGEVRVWSAGCSTGEEAYSVAILLREVIDHLPGGPSLPVKVFATDVDEDAVEQAGSGVFSATVVSEIPSDLVERYFERPHEESFTIRRSIRDMVVFARHNALEDPPLTRMDVVLCRNLMIYLEADAQQHLLRRISFGLNPGGILVLGSSETVGEMVDRFEIVERRLRVYRSRGRAFPLGIEVPRRGAGPRRFLTPARRDAWADPSVEQAQGELLARYVPPAVLVDEQQRLVHVFPGGSTVFKLLEGPATLELSTVLPRPAASAVGAALHRALESGQEVLVPSLKLWPDAMLPFADVRVRPLPVTDAHSPRSLVVFERPIQLVPKVDRIDPATAGLDEIAQERIRFLEEGLAQTQERLQNTIEELESSNEELQATNEELLSSNEELQSTNEELQSVNEELHTVNAEYQNKIRELWDLNDDLDNLFQSTDIGTVFLDGDLKVRRFTGVAAMFLPLLPRDLDRPIAHFARHLPGVDLWVESRGVLERGKMLERELSLGDGRSVLLRISPYAGRADQGGGVVVSFVDITELRQLQDSLAAVMDGLPEHIAVLDSSGVITFVNEAWRRFAALNGGDGASSLGIGANYLQACQKSLGTGDLEAGNAADGLRRVLDGSLMSYTLEYPCHSPTEERWYVLRVAPIRRGKPGAVVSHQDITLRRLAQRGN
jgi:two-component system CheB/CheR fusion protein